MPTCISNALRPLADDLVDTLGVSAAIRICNSNLWHGVLEDIRTRFPDQPESGLEPIKRMATD